MLIVGSYIRVRIYLEWLDQQISSWRFLFRHSESICQSTASVLLLPEVHWIRALGFLHIMPRKEILDEFLSVISILVLLVYSVSSTSVRDVF